MKILMTTDNIGGVWTFAIELAYGLKRHGIEVVLVVIGEELSQHQEKQLGSLPWHHAHFKQEWMEDPWEDTEHAGQWLMKLKDEVRPALVHLNSYTWASLPWGVPVVVTLHSCVLSWWKAVKDEKAPESWDTYYRNVMSGLKAAHQVVAPSGAMLHAAEAIYGTFSKKKVIYNGKNKSDYYSSPKEKFIFSMGRLWDEAKNIQLILNAAPMIDYPIYIAGDEGELRKKTLPPNIHLLGRLSPGKVAQWLSRASVYLMPTKYEPFGYSFLEAAWSRCALVGGDIESLREIWADAMIYVNTDDAPQLAMTVNQLMKKPGNIDYHGNYAYYRAGLYNIERMIRGYLSLYHSLADTLVTH